jgi:hypothetical protein
MILFNVKVTPLFRDIPPTAVTVNVSVVRKGIADLRK